MTWELDLFLIDGEQFPIDGTRFLIDGDQFLIDGLSTGWIAGSIPSRLLHTRLAQTLTSSRLALRLLHTAALSIRLGPVGGEPRSC